MEKALKDFCSRFKALCEALSGVIVGYARETEDLIASLVVGGHVLIEGVPGLGKTLLVRTLASALKLRFKRIQFTPDLMPADITGTHVVHEEGGKRICRFREGPVFANVVLADEINRATPKTQSALLEAMQEGKVTSGGETRELPSPFIVVATQNPIEMRGTYPLPEAQLDRFLLKLVFGRPDEREMVEILERTTGPTGRSASPVAGADEILDMRLQGATVVLLACDTATRPERQNGAGYFPGTPSIGEAFIEIGARAVVGNLWPITAEDGL